MEGSVFQATVHRRRAASIFSPAQRVERNEEPRTVGFPSKDGQEGVWKDRLPSKAEEGEPTMYWGTHGCPQRVTPVLPERNHRRPLYSTALVEHGSALMRFENERNPQTTRSAIRAFKSERDLL